jgi:transposase-like protein
MGYSPDRKAALLKRMLPPNNLPVRQLSQEEGISEATLHKWRAQARGKGQLLQSIAHEWLAVCDPKAARMGHIRAQLFSREQRFFYD